MKNPTPTAIAPKGPALKALRVAAGLTHEALAEAAGVSPSYLSRAENGLVNPTPEWIQLVALAIGNHMADLAAA